MPIVQGYKADIQARQDLNELDANSGEVIEAGEARFVDSVRWINNTGGPLTVPEDTSEASMIATGFTLYEGGGSSSPCYNSARSRGFDRRHLTTLPILEWCGADIHRYTRIYYDDADDKVKSEVHSSSGYFGDNHTHIELRTLCVRPNPAYGDGCYFIWDCEQVNIPDPLTIQISHDNGTHDIFIDNHLHLFDAETIHWSSNETHAFYDTLAPIAQLIWNEDGELAFWENMQSYMVQGASRAVHHLYHGLKFVSGLFIDTITYHDDKYEGITDGRVLNGTIQVDVHHMDKTPFLYRDGTGGVWKETPADNYYGYKQGGRVVYNRYDEAHDEWDLKNIGGDYVVMMFTLFLDKEPAVKKIIGQNLYDHESEGRRAIMSEFYNLDWGDIDKNSVLPLAAVLLHNQGDGIVGHLDHGCSWVDLRYGFPVERE